MAEQVDRREFLKTSAVSSSSILLTASSPAADSTERTALTPRYAQAWSAAEMQAYYKALERRLKASVVAAAAAVRDNESVLNLLSQSRRGHDVV